LRRLTKTASFAGLFTLVECEKNHLQKVHKIGNESNLPQVFGCEHKPLYLILFWSHFLGHTLTSVLWFYTPFVHHYNLFGHESRNWALQKAAEFTIANNCGRRGSAFAGKAMFIATKDYSPPKFNSEKWWPQDDPASFWGLTKAYDSWAMYLKLQECTTSGPKKYWNLKKRLHSWKQVVSSRFLLWKSRQQTKMYTSYK